MHYMTQKIVHLDMDELEGGRLFTSVIKEFMDWCGDDYIFCTWGSLLHFYPQTPLKYILNNYQIQQESHPFYFLAHEKHQMIHGSPHQDCNKNFEINFRGRGAESHR